MSTGPVPLNPDEALRRLGLSLPEPMSPPPTFAAATCANGILYISGQLPFDAKRTLLQTGCVGRQIGTQDARRCAQACALHLLAQIKSELGSLARVDQVLRIAVYVASAPDYTEQHLVADGASELLQAVLGPRGHHARSALGVSALPFGSPVELDAVVSYDPTGR